jgi:hypothetical protein
MGITLPQVSRTPSSPGVQTGGTGASGAITAASGGGANNINGGGSGATGTESVDASSDSDGLTIGLAVGGSLLALLGIFIIVWLVKRNKKESSTSATANSASSVPMTGYPSVAPVYQAAGGIAHPPREEVIGTYRGSSAVMDATMGHYGSLDSRQSSYHDMPMSDGSSSGSLAYVGAANRAKPLTPQW